MSLHKFHFRFSMQILALFPARSSANVLMRSSALLLALVIVLTGCGTERTSRNPVTGETGEVYFSEHKFSSEDHISSDYLQKDFEEFCMDIFKQEMEECSTLDLHYTLLNPEAYGIEPGDASLGSYRLQDMIENHGELEQLKEQLLEYERESLTDKQKVAYDALLETLNTELMAAGLELYEQPLAPTIGVQAQLPILLAEYSFHSLDDVEDYLDLVEQIDEYYGEILEFEKQKADAGLAPSDATIDAIIESCEGYLLNLSDSSDSGAPNDPSDYLHSQINNTSPNHSPNSTLEQQPYEPASSDSLNFLASTFLSRLAELEVKIKLTEIQKTTLIERHDRAIAEHFIPAYELIIDGMTALKGRGINDGGLAGFQDGAKYYQYLIKSGPASSYSVPELKTALTVRMVQDLQDMNQLYTKYPDLNDRIASATFSLTDPKEILEDLKLQISTDFPTLAECDYSINYVPEALEDILSPAFYLTAPLDNPDQNVIYINNAYSDSTDSLYTTLAHEGFPGHLYQTIYNRTSQQDAPLLSILGCSGANEGWATYVEYYANMFDNGLPDGVGEYFALLRSYSLCVHGILDIGVHYEGWTQEEANAFVSSCFQVDDETLQELWQLIINNPTNYLDYCGGFVEIMEMRSEAEEALGDQFSAMEFHRFFLDIGPMPFSVIRTHFAEWLDQQQQSS